MNTIHTNHMPEIYRNVANRQVKGGKTESPAFSEQTAHKSESVVAQYKRKHPEDAYHVNGQVRAGRSVLAKNGADNVCREDMTMDEYKNFINRLMNSIPFDATRVYDREFVSISEAGWQQMKNDPEYEAWVLGYTVENRSVRNPFFGWPGAAGNVYMENFGASIEEHIGQSVGISGPGSSYNNGKNEKSWWEKRRERMKERMEEQSEKAMKKAQARKALEKKLYLNSRLAAQQRLQSFLSESTQESTNMTRFPSAGVNALAVMAYEDNISIFSKSVIEHEK